MGAGAPTKRLVLMRSMGAVMVVVARPVNMEAPRWVSGVSPRPVVRMVHCFAWSYAAHCVPVSAAVRTCAPVHASPLSMCGLLDDTLPASAHLTHALPLHHQRPAEAT